MPWYHKLVGAGRFELPTSPTRKERSTMLSYAPTDLIVPDSGAKFKQGKPFPIDRVYFAFG